MFPVIVTQEELDKLTAKSVKFKIISSFIDNGKIKYYIKYINRKS